MPKEYGTVGPRSILPDICHSRSLARCGLVANALWPRLISQADDQGRLHGDATDLRLLCFPKLAYVTDEDVETAMRELETVGSVIRYVVKGEPYTQLAEWWNYQQHMRRAYSSRFPAPPRWHDFVYGYEGYPATLALARGVPPRPAAPRRVPPLSHAVPSRALPDPSVPRRRRGAAAESTGLSTAETEEPRVHTGLTPLADLLPNVDLGPRKKGTGHVRAN